MFQIGICIVLLVSSFFGVKIYLGVLLAIIVFSLTNIYTITLLVIQFTVITVAGIVGFIISLIVSSYRLAKNTNNQVRLLKENSAYRQQVMKKIRSFVQPFDGKFLLYSLAYIAITVICFLTYHYFNSYENLIVSFIEYVLLLILFMSFVLYTAFLFKIHDKMGGFGCFSILVILGFCFYFIYLILLKFGIN